MNTNIPTGFKLVLLALSLLAFGPLRAAEAPSPLQVEAHPATPAYDSLFNDELVPLDTRLSWTRRFRGDETFNTDETLPPTSSLGERLADSKAASADARVGDFDTSGVIKQLRIEEGKLKIEHGPIDRLGMPAMTMMFRVEDPVQITGLEPGMEIEFNVDNTAAGFAITSLQTVGGGMNYDASGTVKAIRAEQGKVKIEHGPIDKLGMPGMTMLFKVADLTMLENLQRDMTVEFDVMNGPAGFEITRISSGKSANMPMTGARLCYVVGPIAETAQAREIEQRYRDRGATAQLISASERTYFGTMVYVDGQASREAALITAKELQANGFADYLVLDEAGKRNAISLGVFSQQENAMRTRDRVAALNYPAKTEKRYRRQTLYWLHLAQPGTAQSLQLLSADELQSGIGQVPGDCPAQEES